MRIPRIAWRNQYVATWTITFDYGMGQTLNSTVLLYIVFTRNENSHVASKHICIVCAHSLCNHKAEMLVLVLTPAPEAVMPSAADDIANGSISTKSGTRVTASGIFHFLPVREKSVNQGGELNLIRQFVQNMSILHHNIRWRLVDCSGGGGCGNDDSW